MKRIGLVLLLAGVAGASCAGTAQADWHAPNTAVVDIGYFYDALEPYGYWVTLEPYGPVWVPTAVTAGWQPYTDGYWIYTDCGWTWVSYEDWGWAPYHYGRWALDTGYGWVWVPDTVWGPAWVAWRAGDGVIGWAPLPPEIHWFVGLGFDPGGLYFDEFVRPDAWCFIRDRDFVRRHVGRHCFPRNWVEAYVRTTRDVTDYGYVRGRIVDRSLDVKYVEQRTGQRIRMHGIVDRDWRGRPGRTIVRGDAVHVYRPQFHSTDGVRVIDRSVSREAETQRQKNANQKSNDGRNAEPRKTRERQRERGQRR
jgi:hypothetical protein